MKVIYVTTYLIREDLVGEALVTLYRDHGIKREDLFLQTKLVLHVGAHFSFFDDPYDV